MSLLAGSIHHKDMVQLTTYDSDRTVSIDEEQLNYSPLIKTLINTEVHKDMVGESYPIDGVEYRHLNAYVNYLKTGDYDEEVLDVNLMNYMGHNTVDLMTLESLPGYVKVYFEDYWIRDHADNVNGLYGLQLIKTSLNHSDINMPMIKEALSGIEFYIAGGYAYYLTGNSCTFSDVDIFVCSNHLDVFDRLKKLANSIVISDYAMTFCVNKVKYQVILCSYTSPTQIVHMFDIGPCQYIVDPSTDSLYCSKLASWCSSNNAIVFDSLRISSSYIYRLWKYLNYRCNRYNVIFPNSHLINELYERIKYKLIPMVETFRISNDDLLSIISNSSKYKAILEQIDMPETLHNYYALYLIESGRYRLNSHKAKGLNDSIKLITLMGMVRLDIDYETTYDTVVIPEHTVPVWKDPHIFRFGSTPYDTLEEYLATN